MKTWCFEKENPFKKENLFSKKQNKTKQNKTNNNLHLRED